MKLHYYKCPHGTHNMGDDLNPWLWNQLISEYLDDDDEVIFVGFGTILNNTLPVASRTVVWGSGVGYGNGLPPVDDSWHIYCLRGPLSAKALGVDRSVAVTDSAMLIRLLVKPDGRKKYKYSFMPHVSQAVFNGQVYKEILEGNGIHYINPQDDYLMVIDEINRTEVLITESLHGAIVADAMRVPWVPVHIDPIILTFKWQDWAQSLCLDYHPSRLIPFWAPRAGSTYMKRLKFFIKEKLFMGQLSKVIRKAHPILSNKKVLDDRMDMLLNRLEKFKSDVHAGYFNISNVLRFMIVVPVMCFECIQ